MVQAALRRRAHGHRDRVDTPHRGTQSSTTWTDFLVPKPFADDTFPAWCDCGPWTLSRAAVQQWMQAGERRVVLDSA